MPLLEDDVKTAIHQHLLGKGYSDVVSRLGTRTGHDVEGLDPSTRQRLVVECKGEAATGSQHARSWGNVASALLTATTEAGSASGNRVGIALPDTPTYRERCRFLKPLLDREGITMFWVGLDKTVAEW